MLGWNGRKRRPKLLMNTNAARLRSPSGLAGFLFARSWPAQEANTFLTAHTASYRWLVSSRGVGKRKISSNRFLSLITRNQQTFGLRFGFVHRAEMVKLAVVHFGIEIAASQQFLVVALLDNVTIAHDKDQVSIADG